MMFFLWRDKLLFPRDHGSFFTRGFDDKIQSPAQKPQHTPRSGFGAMRFCNPFGSDVSSKTGVEL